jgi:hypothetical protein
MSVYSDTVPVPASVAVGAAVDVSRWNRDITLQLGGTFVATVQFEGSLDGSSWSSIGAALTAGGFVTAPPTVKQVRARTTAFTSGTPVGLVGGRE